MMSTGDYHSHRDGECDTATNTDSCDNIYGAVSHYMTKSL